MKMAVSSEKAPAGQMFKPHFLDINEPKLFNLFH